MQSFVLNNYYIWHHLDRFLYFQQFSLYIHIDITSAAANNDFYIDSLVN